MFLIVLLSASRPLLLFASFTYVLASAAHLASVHIMHISYGATLITFINASLHHDFCLDYYCSSM